MGPSCAWGLRALLPAAFFGAAQLGCVSLPAISPLPEPAPPRVAAPDLASCAREALEHTVTSIADLAIPAREQMRLPATPPLQTFPRLVTPAMLAARTDCGDAWLLPVLFQVDAERLRPDAGARPEQALRFWLEPAAGGELVHTRATSA